jgi:hypothetical protein
LPIALNNHRQAPFGRSACKTGRRDTTASSPARHAVDGDVTPIYVTTAFPAETSFRGEDGGQRACSWPHPACKQLVAIPHQSTRRWRVFKPCYAVASRVPAASCFIIFSKAIVAFRPQAVTAVTLLARYLPCASFSVCHAFPPCLCLCLSFCLPLYLSHP